MSLLSEFRSCWFIATIGCILFIFGTTTIYWNEQRALESLEILNEAFEDAISYKFHPDDEIDIGMYNGRTIHITGPIKITEALIEPVYNIEVYAVKLKRRVQMYQWIEDNMENNFFDIPSYVDAVGHTYSYRTDWHDSLIDYRKFFVKAGHQNPDRFPIDSRTQIANHVFIGDFELGNEVKQQIENYVQITSDINPDDPSIKLHLGLYYHTRDIFNPEVGDIRTLFTYSGSQGELYSVVGKVEKNRIVPFETSKHSKVLLVYRGKMSVTDLFKEEERAQRFMTWCFRIIAITSMFLATICTSTLLQIIFNPIRFIAFMAPDPQQLISTSIMFSFTLSFILITISWFILRPLIVAKVILITAMPILYCSQNYEIALFCILGLSFLFFHFRLW